MKPAQQYRRRLLGLLCLTTLTTITLAACGGNLDDNHESADLYGAYKAISFGMSPSLVRSIIGVDPNDRSIDANGIVRQQWVVDKGTPLFTSLLIQFDGEIGVIGKIITGPEGNFSEVLGLQ